MYSSTDLTPSTYFNCSEIAPNMWIGSEPGRAEDLNFLTETLKITGILTVNTESEIIPPDGINYKHVGFSETIEDYLIKINMTSSVS